MALNDPSWNTDQGVHHKCEYLGAKPICVMKVIWYESLEEAIPSGVDVLTDMTETKHLWWDPKDGQLCLNRVKSEETLMEARIGTDVQIDRQIWV